MPPPHISQMLRVIFQSWAFLVVAHAGVLLYLEYREYAIRREIEQARGFAPKQKRKRTPYYERDEEDGELTEIEDQEPEYANRNEVSYRSRNP